MPHTDREYPYKKLDKYPGMRPEDIAIWETFIDVYSKRFEKVWYNVHVGEPGDTYVDIAGPAEKAWYDLTRWKIDVVGVDVGKFFTIEIKPNANAKALGQALCYAHLFKDMLKLRAFPTPVVLTDEISNTTKKVALMIGVEVWSF